MNSGQIGENQPDMAFLASLARAFGLAMIWCARELSTKLYSQSKQSTMHKRIGLGVCKGYNARRPCLVKHPVADVFNLVSSRDRYFEHSYTSYLIIIVFGAPDRPGAVDEFAGL